MWARPDSGNTVTLRLERERFDMAYAYPSTEQGGSGPSLSYSSSTASHKSSLGSLDILKEFKVLRRPLQGLRPR